MREIYLIFKRLMDILISIIALLVLFPFLAIIALILLCTGEHYVFYFQDRIGYKGTNFRIWKFATMLKNSPNLGSGTITLRNDPRVTKFGKILRLTKLNELPQIVNVLIGDMSIVGPRPLDRAAYLAYGEDIRSRIYNVRPGITGIGSIFFRDEEEMISNSGMNPRDFYKQAIAPRKGSLEIWYNENISFGLDLKIIFLTAVIVIFPKFDLKNFFGNVEL